MNEEKENLKKQVRSVIKILKKRVEKEPEKEILKTLYGRYKSAEKILENNEDINKIMIKGGCRAYLDTFSDYKNVLLLEMNKAEKLLVSLKNNYN